MNDKPADVAAVGRVGHLGAELGRSVDIIKWKEVS
jgi:hypothetical protein